MSEAEAALARDEENLQQAPRLCINVSSELIVAKCECVLTYSDASCSG